MAIQDSALGPQDFRIVKTLASRDAVSPKKEGMIVYVQDENTYYKRFQNGWIDFFIPINSILDLYKVEYRTITALESSDKKLTLLNIPSNQNTVILNVVGGTSQRYGIDFSVNGNILTWDGLGMETIISTNDHIIILYVL